MDTKRCWGVATAFAVGLAVVTAGSHEADAQGKQKGGAAAAAKGPDVADATAKLRSGDPAAIKAALDQARIAGKDAAPLAPAIEELLRRGTSAELAVAAMQTLADIGQSSSSAAIRPYARHRRADLRRAAVKALLKTGGPEAVAALRGALGDADAMVRGMAASGLGALKAKDAVDELFVALDHKVNEAAASIGQLCATEQCEKLAGKLGTINFDIVTSGLDQILFRADVADDEKLRVVGRLRELGTGEANKYLRDVQSRMHAASPRLKQAIDQAVLATGGGATGGKP